MLKRPVLSSFREAFIYGFTWEDPYEDMRRMQLTKEDSVMLITSAGDNALHVNCLLYVPAFYRF